jgi:hypothetical protein
MNFLAGLIGGAAQTGANILERENKADYENSLAIKRQVEIEKLQEKRAAALLAQKRDQDVTDAKTVQGDSEAKRVERAQGIINQDTGIQHTPDEVKKIIADPDWVNNYGARRDTADGKPTEWTEGGLINQTVKVTPSTDRTRAQELNDKSDSAMNLGRPDLAKEFRADANLERLYQRQDDQDAIANRREDNNEKFRTKQLELQIANHKEAMARMGGDSATKKLAQLKLDAMTEENDWRKGIAKLPAGDPKRAAEMQRGMDMGWVKAEPNDVSTTVKTTSGAMTDTPVETSVTTKGRVAKDAPQSESQAQADAQRFIAAGKISLADANKRLESAGFKPLASDATKPAPIRSLQELKRIAAKPKGTSTAEANAAQAEIDYLRNNPDRIGAF